MLDDQLSTAENAVAATVIFGKSEARWGADHRVARGNRPFGTIATSAHDWAGSDFEKQSMRLMAQEVMPLLRSAAPSTNAAAS